MASLMEVILRVPFRRPRRGIGCCRWTSWDGFGCPANGGRRFSISLIRSGYRPPRLLKWRASGIRPSCPWRTGAGSGYFTNCILATVASLVAGGSSFTITGAYNGFYLTSAFGNNQVSSAWNPFQTAVAGAHYLLSTNSFVDAGTPNVHSVALMEIRAKTTQSPTVLENSSNPGTFDQVVLRDTNAPDLGFHYEALDYLVHDIALTQGLLMTNGVAVGLYQTNGFILGNGGKLIGQGTPTAMNVLTRYSSVQENISPTYGRSAEWTVLTENTGLTNAPEARLRFTDVSLSAVSESSGNDAGTFVKRAETLNILSLVDCQLYGAQIVFTNGGTCALTNNLFVKPQLTFADGANKTTVQAWNNTMVNSGSLVLNPNVSNLWAFEDNIFEITNITQNGNSITNAYNGYMNSSARLTPTNANDQVVGTFYWVIGAIGRYYQPSDSIFINAGSRYASNAFLYHHTTQLAETKEANTLVDLGFHYVSLRPTSTNIWVEDVVPSGASAVGDSDGWNWVLSSPSPASGSKSHQSADSPWTHQHYFYNAPTNVVANRGDSFVTYVYIDTNSVPSQIMIQLYEYYTGWTHRAYWGTGGPPWGNDRTYSARYMGPVPTTGQWVRLEIAPDAGEFAGVGLSGLAFTMTGGKATWDLSGPTTMAPFDGDSDGLPDYLEDINENGSVDAGENSF